VRGFSRINVTKYGSVEQVDRGIPYQPFSYLQDIGFPQWACCSSGVGFSAL
jgi:hypothetical protein